MAKTNYRVYYSDIQNLCEGLSIALNKEKMTIKTPHSLLCEVEAILYDLISLIERDDLDVEDALAALHLCYSIVTNELATSKNLAKEAEIITTYLVKDINWDKDKE